MKSRNSKGISWKMVWKTFSLLIGEQTRRPSSQRGGKGHLPNRPFAREASGHEGCRLGGDRKAALQAQHSRQGSVLRHLLSHPGKAVGMIVWFHFTECCFRYCLYFKLSLLNYPGGIIRYNNSIVNSSNVQNLLNRFNRINQQLSNIWTCWNQFLKLFQLVLDEDDENDRKMANKLITIYFSFFKSSIKKGEIDSKLVC